MEIPNKIIDLIKNKNGTKDTVGLSGASVYLFDDMVLKIQENGPEAENEHKMMIWLKDKLPVPEIIEYENTNKFSYLLMGRCSGETACSDQFMAQPVKQAKLLANTLQEIWQVDWSTCPTNATLDAKLKRAAYNVANNLVDVNNCEPKTFGPGGFRSPDALLNWLLTNRPSEELVLSHGDFCLPNILFLNDRLSGLLDLGRAGVADKWCDIALCYRSIKNNFSGVYTGKEVSGYDESYLFDCLQIKPDWDKIRYYILLDELF